jgi:hypothetical protein
MSRTNAIGAVLVLSSLLLCLLELRELRLRGGAARARTIVSRTGFAPRDSEDAMLLLQEAAERIPQNAEVRVLRPDRPESIGVFYAVAVGQMPGQVVLSPDSPKTPGYLVVFHGTQQGGGFTEMWRGAEGTILRRR